MRRYTTRMPNNPEGGAEHQQWEFLRTELRFESYEHLKIGLAKELGDLGAGAAKVQIINVPEGRPHLYAVFDTFVVELRGGRTAPRVSKEGEEGVLYPGNDFKIWWQKVFPRIRFGVYQFKISHIKKLPKPAHAPAQKTEEPEVEVAAQPVVETAPPEQIPEDAESFSTLPDLQRNIVGFFAAMRARSPQPEARAKLSLYTEGQSDPLAFELRHPGPRATVVWVYSGDTRLFSLVGRNAALDLERILDSEDRGAVRRFVLEPL